MSHKSPGVLVKTTFSIPVKITIGVILGAISLIVVVAYACIPSIRDELKFAVAVVGGAAAVYTGWYAAATLRLSVENTKKQKAFEILQVFDRPELIRIRDIIDEKIDNDKISPEQVYDMIIKQEDLRRAVTTQLDLFEDLAIAIGEDYVNEKVLYVSLMRVVPRIYHSLQCYIEKERDRYNSRIIYSEFQHLAEAWAKRRSVRTGKPLVYAPPDG